MPIPTILRKSRMPIAARSETAPRRRVGGAEKDDAVKWIMERAGAESRSSKVYRIRERLEVPRRDRMSGKFFRRSVHLHCDGDEDFPYSVPRRIRDPASDSNARSGSAAACERTD